jgi:hypothetical protein
MRFYRSLSNKGKLASVGVGLLAVTALYDGVGKHSLGSVGLKQNPPALASTGLTPATSVPVLPPCQVGQVIHDTSRCSVSVATVQWKPIRTGEEGDSPVSARLINQSLPGEPVSAPPPIRIGWTAEVSPPPVPAPKIQAPVVKQLPRVTFVSLPAHVEKQAKPKPPAVVSARQPVVRFASVPAQKLPKSWTAKTTFAPPQAKQTRRVEQSTPATANIGGFRGLPPETWGKLPGQ